MNIPEWMTKEKTTLIQKDLQNVPTNDVENTNSTNEWDLQIANKLQTVSRRTERMPNGNKKNSKSTLHWSTYLQGVQNKMKKSSYGVDWLQKDLWYGPVKQDNRMFQNVQNIRQCQKVYRGNHKKLESRNDNRKKKLNWGESPESIFQRDALSPLLFVMARMPLNHVLKKCTGGYKLHKSQEKSTT